MHSDLKNKKYSGYDRKDVHYLESELLNMLREKCNLYIQLKTGQLKKTHLLKQVRYKIARIKYDLSKIFRLR